jgi:hypothetical protein
LAVAEEQESPPPIPLGNQGEAASTEGLSHHTIVTQRESDDATAPADSVKNEVTPLATEETPDPVDVIMHEELKEIDMDLLSRIHGLYRLLDLISEQGSGGAGTVIASSMTQGNSPRVITEVEKIIIAQNSMAKLVNDMCPGAYTSMTKVRIPHFAPHASSILLYFRRLTSIRWMSVI